MLQALEEGTASTFLISKKASICTSTHVSVVILFEAKHSLSFKVSSKVEARGPHWKALRVLYTYVAIVDLEPLELVAWGEPYP